MIRLVLLGGLRLEAEEGPLTGRASQKRRLALLALLAVPPGHLLTRDKLLGYLWPDREEEGARRLLSAALYDLRRELGDDAITSPGDEVGLDPARIDCDAAAFLDALDAGDYEAAVALYGGPFLDGVHLGASAEFERWVDAERQRYASKYRDALERLAAQRQARGDICGTAGVWRRLANEDPTNKRIALGYMHALVAAGERARAIQFAGVHTALLREELDAEPDPEVTAFAERLREEPPETHAAAALPPPAHSGTASAPPEPTTPAPPVPGASLADVATSAATPGSASGFAPAPAGPSVSTPGGRWRTPPGARTVIVLAAVAVVAVGVIAVVAGRLVPARPGGADVIRLAVLPMDYRGDDDAEGLAVGLTEELLVALTRVDRFRGPGLSSALAYLDEGRPTPEIARELGVDYVLGVSFRSDEARVRAAVTLEDASGDLVWGKTYTSDVGGDLELQERIARAVVEELRPRLTGELSGEAEGPLIARTSASPEARRHFLRARGLWFHRGPADLLAARAELEQAVALDSTYARAYAGLADVYNTMGAYTYALLPPGNAYPTARAAAERALALESDLPEAHAALGVALFNYFWDWDAAEHELRTALELNPGDSMIRHWYSLLLRITGRWAEAMAQIQEAQEVDPRSAVIAVSLCQHDYFERRFERAVEVCRHALSLDSTYVQAHLALGMAAVQLGHTDVALGAYATASRLLGVEDAPVVVALTAHAYGAAGDTAHARRLYLRLASAAHRPAPAPYIGPHFLAVAALGAGLEREAVTWLATSLKERSAAFLYMGVEPIIDPLWDDDSFRSLLARARAQGLGPVLDARIGAGDR